MLVFKHFQDWVNSIPQYNLWLTARAYGLPGTGNGFDDDDDDGDGDGDDDDDDVDVYDVADDVADDVVDDDTCY